MHVPPPNPPISCQSLDFLDFLDLCGFPSEIKKNPKHLEIEKRCRGVSHLLTRYRFNGFFGSWPGGGLSLSPSIV